MEGYYEPEWEEEAIYGWLRSFVVYGGLPESLNKGIRIELMKILDVSQKLIDDTDAWMKESIEKELI